MVLNLEHVRDDYDDDDDDTTAERVKKKTAADVAGLCALVHVYHSRRRGRPPSRCFGFVLGRANTVPTSVSLPANFVARNVRCDDGIRPR